MSCWNEKWHRNEISTPSLSNTVYLVVLFVEIYLNAVEREAFKELKILIGNKSTLANTQNNFWNQQATHEVKA